MFLSTTGEPSVHVVSGTSGSFGCGAILGDSQWLQIPWPPSWGTIDIVSKELVPIVVAAAVWGHSWSKTLVQFRSDNMAVVEILRRRSARNPLTHHLLRCFYFYSALFQFDYCIAHIPGVVNVAADALSRDNLLLFCSLVLQAGSTTSAVPPPDTPPGLGITSMDSTVRYYITNSHTCRLSFGHQLLHSLLHAIPTDTVPPERKRHPVVCRLPSTVWPYMLFDTLLSGSYSFLTPQSWLPRP